VGALETAGSPADQRQSADSCPFSSVTRLVLRRLQQSRVVAGACTASGSD
jgi:hypothetical protein